jgi:hypothetical protein
MDLKESSAMTEASGLVSGAEGAGSASGEGPRPLGMRSQEDVMRWADKLREVTVKAPLQSLFVAFVLGVWVARRR